MDIQQYMSFSQDFNESYKISSKLFNHSKIIRPKYRAKLFQWLSEECSKQKINRFAFVLTCSYVDLYFMKGNDVKKKEDYQYLALGALILACKQVQKQGKVPFINTNLISVNTLLQMEKNIISKLDYYLNPPNYIQILNNIAKIWDFKWNKQNKYLSIRYLEDDVNSIKKIKKIYQILDCINLFHEILDYDIFQIVLTVFYVLTKNYYLEAKQKQNTINKEECLKKIHLDQFEVDFYLLLMQYQIKTSINNQIINKTILLKDLEISYLDESINQQLISKISLFQTYNLNAYKKAQLYYQKQDAIIYKKQSKIKMK